MKPYPFDASNHLMTPLISTRLVLSPMPSASIIGSRPGAPANSSGPSLRLGPVTPDDKAPNFLDSNPSDPMTPDPTHSSLWPILDEDGDPHALIEDNSQQRCANLSNQKITFRFAAHS